MIKTFKCKETQKIFDLHGSKKVAVGAQKIALRKLEMLDYAVEINDLRVPPANRLEQLKGNRKGQYSIRINRQWRVCFVWRNGHAYQVEIVDYHK
jgi:proteic killer suppression protein